MAGAVAAIASRVAESPRHTAVVRITHWISAACFLALLVTGLEIVASHPRFYWGETGNVNTTPLFSIPIPSSRASVPTGYGYVLQDQNGWSRSLHFESAWIVIFTGLVYFAYGAASRHFAANVLPDRGQLSPAGIAASVADHLRFRGLRESDLWSYNGLQRIAYSAVIFVLFPVAIWTGLAMSPSVVSAAPAIVSSLGGQQSARTLHFAVTVLLLLFFLAHVLMVIVTGFGQRMRAMISGNPIPKERA